MAQARRRSQSKQNLILEAAIKLAGEHGYSGTRIEHVAAEAGAGKQTIYRWWPTKADLMAEAYAHLVPAEALTYDGDDPYAALEHLSAVLFGIFSTTPAPRILAGLIAEAQGEEAAAKALRANLLVGRRDILTAPLKRGLAAGKLPPDFDVEAAADHLVAAVWHRVLTDPSKLTDAFRTRLIAETLPPRKESKLSIRDYFPGALGQVAAMHGAGYAAMRGFGRPFEVMVAGDLAELLGRFDPKRDMFKVICRGDEVVASIGVDGGGDPSAAQLRWFLVAKSERGAGLGRNLLSMAISFARESGHKRMKLWTGAGLDEARHLYDEAGFKLIREVKSTRWGPSVTEQLMEMPL